MVIFLKMKLGKILPVHLHFVCYSIIFTIEK